MVSIKTTLLALATALVVSADYYIDPKSVPLSKRKSWCQSELSTCPLICQQIPPGTTITNTCDPDTLTYGCVCGNGLQPNVSEYTLTLPYFVCQEWGVQCVASCGIDNTCASKCQQDHPCGATNPTRDNTTSSTSTSASATASSTGTQVATGLSSTNTAALDPFKSAGAVAFEFGRGYGIVVLAGSLFAGFALML